MAEESGSTDIKERLRGIPKKEYPWYEFSQLLEEIKDKESSKYLALCVALAFAKEEFNGSQREKGERVARTGAILIDLLTQHTIDCAAKGESFLEISKKLDRELGWFVIFSLFPVEVYSSGMALDQKDRIVRAVLVGDKKALADPKFKVISNKIEVERRRVKYGVLGELFAYCLLKQSGYSVRHASSEEDFCGTDIYVDNIPVQVKANPNRADGGIFNATFSPESRYDKAVVVGIDSLRISNDIKLAETLVAINQQQNILELNYPQIIRQVRDNFIGPSQKCKAFL